MIFEGEGVQIAFCLYVNTSFSLFYLCVVVLFFCFLFKNLSFVIILLKINLLDDHVDSTKRTNERDRFSFRCRKEVEVHRLAASQFPMT